MMESDYYKALGIERGASKTDIKRAYYSKVKIYPPEKYPERFKALREAYECLSDDEKRASYDLYAGFPAKTAAAIREANRLMNEGEYEEAAAFIKKQKKNDILDSLLIHAYLLSGNTGNAVKLAEKAQARRPGDPGAYVHLLNAYQYRGYTHKVLETAEKALSKFPGNPVIISECVWAYHKVQHDVPEELIDSLLAVADKAASYQFETFGVCINNELDNDREGRIPELFSHYADGLISAPSVNSNQYKNAVYWVEELVYAEACFATAKRLAPFLENHEFRNEHTAALIRIRNMITLTDFMSKNEFHHTLVGYLATINMKPGSVDEEDKSYFADRMLRDADSVKPSLIKLRDNYPQLFELDKAFFVKLLNTKTHRKYNPYRDGERVDRALRGGTDDLGGMLGEIKDMLEKLPNRDRAKALREIKKNLDEDDIVDEAFFDDVYESGMPYVRAERKIGRNEPCPCGSGKKYKQCCGRVGEKAANL